MLGDLVVVFEEPEKDGSRLIPPAAHQLGPHGTGDVHREAFGLDSDAK